MSKTYFAVSDTHSFYRPLMAALTEAGYDKSDPDHVLVLCGDAFDRGPDSVKMLKFLRSLPKENRILIRGNHERLLDECFQRGFYCSHDRTNGTLRTMCDISGVNFKRYDKLVKQLKGREISVQEYVSAVDAFWEEATTKPFQSQKLKETIDWINSDDWVNYFRLGNLVFVHAWIPVKQDPAGLDLWGDKAPEFSYDEDWESRSEKEWDVASWLCPWKAFLSELGPSAGDTIVCGHWHVQDFHKYLGLEEDGDKNREIYYSDRLIALDAMTAMKPHVCNVLVIKDGKCYDKHGNVLGDKKEEE